MAELNVGVAGRRDDQKIVVAKQELTQLAHQLAKQPKPSCMPSRNRTS